MPIQKIDNKTQSLLPSALTLTTSYQDLGALVGGGPLINVMDCDSIALWLNIDINDSTGLNVKMLAAQTDVATDFYSTPIKDVTASVINIQPTEYLFTNNVDQKMVITFPVSDQLIFVKFQVKVTVLGATAGQILSAGVSFTSSGSGL